MLMAARWIMLQIILRQVLGIVTYFERHSNQYIIMLLY